MRIPLIATSLAGAATVIVMIAAPAWSQTGADKRMVGVLTCGIGEGKEFVRGVTKTIECQFT